MHFIWLSAGLIVVSNVAYHVCQKSIPPGVDPVGSVIITYIVATVVSLGILPAFSSGSNAFLVARNLSWANVLLGISIIGIEIGYLLLYRSGWNVSVGQVFCNTLVALLLIPIGVFLFKEKLIVANYVGIILAMLGIYLITVK